MSKRSTTILIIVGIVIVAVVILFIFLAKDEEDATNTNTATNKRTTTNTTNTNTVANESTDTNTVTNENANTNTALPKNTNTTANANVETNTNTESETCGTGVNPTTPAKGDITVTASSTLTDTTGAGFTYSPWWVTDNNFSTSWVESADGDGTGEWIRFAFDEPACLSTIGIVPGYGRDETIYYENNRVNALTLTFSDGTAESYFLSDLYAMQFLEFDTIATTSVLLTINTVHEGSEYNDTSIAELDIWSDYVLNKDPDAAYDYYLENHAPTTDLPTEVPEIIDAYLYMPEGGMVVVGRTTFTPAMEPIVTAIVFADAVPEGTTFEVRWYHEGTLYHTDSSPRASVSPMDGVTTVTSDTGVSLFLPPPAVLWTPGSYSAEWYMNDELVRTQPYTVSE